MIDKALKSLGFNDDYLANFLDHKASKHSLARVMSVHKERYIVNNGVSNISAELTGHFLYTSDSSIDFPTTGDWVFIDSFDDDSLAIIHQVLPRKSLLKRKSAGQVVDIQLIAANLDCAFIVQSANENFNLRRLERYLVMVNESDIKPIILLSKSDLVPQFEIDDIKNQVLSIAPNTEIIEFSNATEENLERIKNTLITGQTYCLLGSSGVGKTTLLNSLIGHDQYTTQTVSKKESKGRHTTTRRELIQLENGALIIDTPGMRELGNLSSDSGIEVTFQDIIDLSDQCHFKNCSHSNEKGCRVLDAIQDGTLTSERYNSYLKMKRELAFNDMSYVEKRSKDKAFSKKIKTVMKNKKR